MARKGPNPPAGRSGQPAKPNAEEQHQVIVGRTEWAGPLPPPQVLEQFNQVIPDGAARIVREWEAESEHRRQWERKALDAQIREGLLARILAFAFALAALGTAGYCAYLGQPWPAAVIGGGTIAAVVTAMLYSRRE